MAATASGSPERRRLHARHSKPRWPHSRRTGRLTERCAAHHPDPIRPAFLQPLSLSHTNKKSLASIEAPFMNVIISCEARPLNLSCHCVVSFKVKFVPARWLRKSSEHTDDATLL